MKLIKKKIASIKDLLSPTYPEFLECLNKENKELRKRLAVELKKSKAKEKTLKEIKRDNFNLAREINDKNKILQNKFYL